MMRCLDNVLIFTFFIIIIPHGYSQIDIEQEIISALIKNEIKPLPNDTIFNRKGQIKKINTFIKPDIVLLSETITYFMSPRIDSLGYYKKGLPSLDEETYNDFCEKKNSSIMIDSIPYFDGTITYITKSDKEQIFGKQGWEYYHLLFDSKPFIQISRPGINSFVDKAIIYYTISNSGRSGIGFYLLLVKVNDKWMIKNTMTAWIS